MPRFASEIQDLATEFASLQAKRHATDYDPEVRLTKTEVLNDHERAGEVMRRFDGTSKKDRRAFAFHLILAKRLPND